MLVFHHSCAVNGACTWLDCVWVTELSNLILKRFLREDSGLTAQALCIKMGHSCASKLNCGLSLLSDAFPPPLILSRRGWSLRSVTSELGPHSQGLTQSKLDPLPWPWQLDYLNFRLRLVWKPFEGNPIFGSDILCFPVWDLLMSCCMSGFCYSCTSNCECRWLDYVTVTEFINIPNPEAVANRSGQHTTCNLSRP